MVSRVLTPQFLSRARRCAALALIVAAGIEVLGILPPYDVPPITLPGLG